MTAHDPRMTLTEVEVSLLSDLFERNHFTLLIGEVERIIAARLAPIRALAEDYDGWEIDEIDVPWIALADLRAALDAPVSASQDHDWHQPLTHCHCGRVIPCRHHDGAEGQRTRLGRRLETILAQRWPDSGVNPWLLADLLAEEQGEGEKAGDHQWACDGCMAWLARADVSDWCDGEHVLCKSCDRPDEENR